MRLRPIMHMDGCHFYVWLGKPWGGTETVLLFSERDAESLVHWGRWDTCARCLALRKGAAPRSVIRRDVEVPEHDGAGALLATVVGMASDIDRDGV